MFHEEMTAYYATLADFHPSVLRWSGSVLQGDPMLAPTFAITLKVIIQQAQFPEIDDEMAHDAMISMIDQEAGPTLRRLGISLPVPSIEVFSKLARSFRDDAEISKHLLREPLMMEKGPFGILRKMMWAEGMREPEVSERLAELRQQHPIN
ncbi:hypothetical protein HGO38_19470 [Rhizobium sp. CG5]|uniref:hypothetical protein n=1 Tax=Rhizobium sp. CG5 TaxID=2726076 RepID=UPI0020335C95|nr:hypothetical protein [Rhizobium sp. CG5]MCM2475658.1 hypothetical protein [Rhizobium sp. CG5]